jgi:glutamate synthase (NADPH/NADH) small chain
MRAEGVEFRTSVCVGKEPPGRGVPNDATEMLAPDRLRAEFDAVVLCGGAEQARDLPIPGRELDGIHFAMEFLPLQNKRVAGDKNVQDLWASGKHVVIIGGGDTGSDCVGTANRHRAASVTNFELLPMPPDVERNPVWPYWPTRLRTSSSHEEGVERDWSVASKRFIGENGKVRALEAVRLEWKDGKPVEVPGSEFTLPADLVLLAMGFVSPVQSLLAEFGVRKDARGNAQATTDGAGCYATSVPKVFAAGDMRRGQSLVVWAIREGRQAARAVDEYLMGASELPR